MGQSFHRLNCQFVHEFIPKAWNNLVARGRAMKKRRVGGFSLRYEGKIATTSIFST